MSVQAINQLVPVERDPAHNWGMALYSFRAATQAICELAKTPDYRDFALDDLDSITDAVLAANLMWSFLKGRKAA